MATGLCGPWPAKGAVEKGLPASKACGGCAHQESFQVLGLSTPAGNAVAVRTSGDDPTSYAMNCLSRLVTILNVNVRFATARLQAAICPVV